MTGPYTPDSLAEMAAYVPVAWVFHRLGLSESTFYKARPKLEAEGFPTVDPIVRRYLRADVETWIENRRRVQKDRDRVEGSAPEINFGAL